MLRMMFGDEKFLMGHDYDFPPPPSSLGSPHSQSHKGGHQIISSGGNHDTNPYFLATNSSVFDRNPFHEFTSNKLQDLLANKNLHEV